MKLIAIIVCRCPRSSQELGFLSAAYDLSGYAFYQRNTVKEGLKFIARTAIPRLPVGSQQEVEHEGSVAFVYRYPDSLAILAIGDREYPRRVAFACLNEVHADFTRSVSMPVWVRAGSQGAAAKSSTSNHPDVHYRDRLAELLKKYKNPMQSDELVRALQKAEQAQLCGSEFEYGAGSGTTDDFYGVATRREFAGACEQKRGFIEHLQAAVQKHHQGEKQLWVLQGAVSSRTPEQMLPN